MKDTEKALGKKGERFAARYLRRHGYRILARNVHCGHNELDIVAKNKEVIAFVEVKTRSFASEKEAELARPALAVDTRKRRRTIDAAFAFLRRHPSALTPRMDVMELYFTREKRPALLRVVHIEDAFGADGRPR